MRSLYLRIARSRHPLLVWAKRLFVRLEGLTLPAPRLLVLPLLWLVQLVRATYHVLTRLLVCEPIFKAHCKTHGRGVRTGPYIHWITGSGDLIVGDDVLLDGKCSIRFAWRFDTHPTLRIGSRTGIGHGCAFGIGKSITIGEDCRVAGHVWVFDSNGHPSDPTARRAGLPPPGSEVRPVAIGNNVWIGGRAIIHPGVTIGEGSIVSAGAVVMADVPPYTVVAGNPARRIAALRPVDGPHFPALTDPDATRTPPLGR